jgi:carbamoyltransferase
LLKLFYDKTKTPVLLNTSFNLNGYPIVETYEDALFTCKESNIRYLYTP